MGIGESRRDGDRCGRGTGMDGMQGADGGGRRGLAEVHRTPITAVLLRIRHCIRRFFWFSFMFRAHVSWLLSTRVLRLPLYPLIVVNGADMFSRFFFSTSLH